jgi:hypothetical protein
LPDVPVRNNNRFAVSSQEAVMEPFRFFRSLTIPQSNQGVIASFTAPQNRILRIEFIAGDVTLTAGESSFIAVTDLFEFAQAVKYTLIRERRSAFR